MIEGFISHWSFRHVLFPPDLGCWSMSKNFFERTKAPELWIKWSNPWFHGVHHHVPWGLDPGLCLQEIRPWGQDVFFLNALDRGPMSEMGGPQNAWYPMVPPILGNLQLFPGFCCISCLLFADVGWALMNVDKCWGFLIINIGYDILNMIYKYDI